MFGHSVQSQGSCKHILSRTGWPHCTFATRIYLDIVRHALKCAAYIMHILCIYALYAGWSLWSCTTLPLIACSLTWAGGSPHQVWLSEEKNEFTQPNFAMIDNELMCILGTAQSCWNLAWRAPVRSVTNPLKTLPLAQSWDCLTYRF